MRPVDSNSAVLTDTRGTILSIGSINLIAVSNQPLHSRDNVDVPPCTRFVNCVLKTGSLSETEAPSGAPSEQNRISIVVLADRLFKGRRPNCDFFILLAKSKL